MSISGKLASFVEGLSFKELPLPVVRMAKLAFLDTLGVSLAGSREPSSQIIVNIVRATKGIEESTVIGQRFRAPSQNAALANSTMAHALEFDDTTTDPLDVTRIGLHAGGPIVSAALAISETTEASGKDFIVAVTAAYDIASRLTYGVPTLEQSSRVAWHITGVFGTFAAATAASKLLEFSIEQIVNAFGLAGSQASGILQSLVEGTPLKPVQSGLAARNGVLSALMTQAGLKGPTDVFEGDFGFYNAFYDGAYDGARITNGLGRLFSITYDSFKLYPTCASCHSSIAAALKLTQTHNINSNDVQEIRIWVSEQEYRYVCTPTHRKIYPRTVVDAQFSIPFAVATALVKGVVTLDHISEKGIRDVETLNLAKKVKTVADSNLSGQQCVVEIRMRDGQRFSKRIDLAEGGPQNPASERELLSKFRSCASRALSEQGQIEEVIDIILNLEKLKNMTALVEIIS